MGLDMMVREIRTWEKRELANFVQSVLKSIYNVNNPNVNEEFDLDSFILRNPTIAIPYQIGEELCYWRKHPDLHGWMRDLFYDKGGKSETSFNNDIVFLSVEDVENLRIAITEEKLPHTSGFFFGESDVSQKYADLEEIDKILYALKKGSLIYYTSSW
jgi:hypothetical protein